MPSLILACAQNFMGRMVYVVVLIASLAYVAYAQQEPTPREMWYGEMDAEVRVFRFAITIQRNKDATDWTGDLVSIDEGGRSFRLDGIQRSEKELKFEITSTKAVYRGVRGESAFDGKWKQGGGELPLRFELVEKIPDPENVAIWKGQLDAVVQKLDVAFREQKDGRIFFDSLSQKMGGFVVKKQQTKDKVTFEVPAVKGVFEGQLSEDAEVLDGQWKQSLLPIKLKLQKVTVKELGVAAPKRPQTPTPPYPYDSQTFSVENPQAPGVRLEGTLTLPRKAGRVPAIVLISGSGPQDRDETIVEHKPFLVLADHLTRNGYAVLRFDDRGVGASTGNFSQATTRDFASDVKALVQALRNHERIDSNRIGLCGHSEGGLVGPIVASENDQIAFLILLAGTGVNGEQILISQTRLIMEASRIDKNSMERQLQSQAAMLKLAKERPNLSKQEFAEAARKIIDPLLDEKQRASEEAKLQIEQSANQLTTPWFQYFLTHEPSSVLERVKCPVLILNGSKDLQVDATLNVPAIEAALERGGNKSYASFVLPNLNHLFQTCTTGNVSEYGEIEETFSPVAMDKLTEWLSKTLPKP